VLWPLVAFLRLWGRTLKFEIPESDLALFRLRDEPVIFVLWHNRLFAVPELFRHLRPTKRIHALISASKDGAWLAAFFELAGVPAADGGRTR
jgi:lysophospholipid acyltransferase (LPLAT)-like uncharacterized protein